MGDNMGGYVVEGRCPDCGHRRIIKWDKTLKTKIGDVSFVYYECDRCHYKWMYLQEIVNSILEILRILGVDAKDINELKEELFRR